MASNFIAMVYAVLKDKGVDTKGMSADEAVERYEELTGKTGRYSTATGKRDNPTKTKQVNSEVNLDDEYIGKSVGAKSKNYDIQYGDKTVHLVEGTYLRNKEIIAGKGRKRKIDEIDGLVKRYGGSADKWVKVKGIGTVNNDGKNEDVEIHWYEEPSIGKVKLKVKDE